MTRPSAPAHVGRSKLKAWADEQNTDAPWHRLLHLVVRLIPITAAEFLGNALSLRSAALTYTVLLSLVPILAMSTALVKGLGGDNQLRKVAYSYIQSNSRISRTAFPLAIGPDHVKSVPVGGFHPDCLSRSGSCLPKNRPRVFSPSSPLPAPA